MKKLLILTLALVFSLNYVRADEGMWLLTMLQSENYQKMQEMGLELSPEQIYSINNSSLKDAIGALDGGSCTAELVSAEGLLLTNHHCGYDEIQNHSSIENNYLKNGFWAMSKADELPNPGKTITFVVRIEDVTDKVLPYLSNDLSLDQRADSVSSLSQKMIEDATKGTHYSAYVRDFYNGNKYILFVNETFRDVRLVGAPPESIGKFGHDTDNWMWPRHTGDFAMFRVYTGPNGEPADYSPDNIPLKSKHFLPVSMNGYKKGDYAMILGFPGTTNRYMTSYEVNELLEIEHPNRIKIRGIKQEIMKEDMLSSEEIKIMYSAKYSQSSNYWKYSIGQTKGLNDLDVVGRKEKLENDFTNWVNKDDQRKEKYGNTLNLIKEGVEGRKDLAHSSQYLFECMYQGMETVQMGNSVRFMLQELSSEEPNFEMIERISSFVKNNAEEFYNEYHMPTDKKITRAMLKLMIEDVPDQYLPVAVKEVKNKYGVSKLDKYIDKYFSKSILTSKEKLFAFLDDPKLKTLQKDPGIDMTMSFIESYFGYDAMSASADAKVEQGARLWIMGQMEMNPDTKYYPDANSTLRLTYGEVGDYKPKDAVYYSYFTTTDGIIEKEDPTNPEFVVSEKLSKMIAEKDFGRYDTEGVLNVCFTTNNDITGGNSGSPVINGKGELIGIAFDGNWESMSGDVAFEPELQKCINVDIRFVLFVIDEYAGAGHLVDEMKVMN